jgi:hypothetical protein
MIFSEAMSEELIVWPEKAIFYAALVIVVAINVNPVGGCPLFDG